MARIPNADLQRIKRELPLSSLVALKVPLTPRGKDQVGRCPFHADDTASFVVTDAKGLWHPAAQTPTTWSWGWAATSAESVWPNRSTSIAQNT